MPDKTPTKTRRRRYTPMPSPVALISLTPVKVQMLRFLAELRFLSLPQLARLCCPAERRDLSEKSARRHLRTLFDAGLVDVLPVSRAALAQPDSGNDASLLYGSAPNVYVPTAAGLKALCRVGLASTEVLSQTRPSYGPKNSLFLAHELAVRDVRVWLNEVIWKDGYELECWRDGETAAISLGQRGTLQAVRPDAWFSLRLGKAVLVGLVEVDRGTERGDRHWREKLANYEALYARSGLQAATGYVNARILVICPDARRRDWLASLLGELGGATGRFWLAYWADLGLVDLTSTVWRRPGDPILQPLVSVTFLQTIV